MAIDSLFDAIPPHWKELTLGEICKQSGGEIQIGPFGSQLHAEDYVVHGVPSIMPQNIGDNHIDTTDISRVSAEDVQRLKKHIVQKGDIVYSRRGDITRRALIHDWESGWLCGTGCIRIRPGKEALDSAFAFYYLGHPKVRNWIASHAVGATMPNLNTSILSNIPFLLPPLDEQKEIARSCQLLDRKIENLRRQNETLEAIAQTLFKHWFVDFEFPNADGKPYKSSGGEMVPSAISEIPAGWRIGKLGEIYKTTSGGTPSRKEPDYYAENGYLWVKSKELYSNFILDTEEKITPLGLKNSSAKILPEKTILIAMYGATVGQVSVLGVESTCNQAICAVLEQKHSNYFIYLWLKHTQQEWTGMAIGSAQQNLSQVLISKIEIVIPTLNINSRFSSVVAPIFQKMLVHSRQIQTLTKTRD